MCLKLCTHYLCGDLASGIFELKAYGTITITPTICFISIVARFFLLQFIVNGCTINFVEVKGVRAHKKIKNY